jgi:acetoin utilization deacetylase AcuC-like enzyme
MYVAGADPYYDDQLGGLMLTMEGLRKRDELVLGTAVERKIPAAITLAGGYARKLDDTITIQSGTARVAAAVLA